MGRTGFLTDGPKGQRAYLRGDYDPPTDNAENKKRSDIRKQTKASIQDLGLVARSNQLRPEDRALILETETPDQTAEASERVEIVEQDGEKSLRFPGTGEGKHVRLPLDTDTPDSDANYGLWGPVGVWREMGSIIKWLYLMLREDGATRESLSATVEEALESAEGEYRHGWPGLMKHNDVDATVTIETPDDVDVESAKRRHEREIALTPMEMKALVVSGEYEIRSVEESDEK